MQQEENSFAVKTAGYHRIHQVIFGPCKTALLFKPATVAELLPPCHQFIWAT